MKLTLSLALCAFFPILAAIPVTPGATVFENDQVKVVRALEKTHVKGKVHEHKTNRVMIYLQAGQQQFEYQDGRKAETFHWKAGQVVWSPASGPHQPEVTGDDSFNILEVELKQPGSGKAFTSEIDPVKIDPKHYKVEFENDQVRVLRVKTEPHQMGPMHEHSTNRVNVYLSAQPIRVTLPDGSATTSQRKDGDAVWAAPVKHQEENAGDKPFEAILVELK